MTMPPSSAVSLTQYQREVVEHLDSVGFAVVPNVIDDAVVRQCRERIERLYANDPGVEAHRRGPLDPLHVEVLPNKGAEFETFFLTPAILPIVEHFLGPDCVLQDVWSSGVAPGADPFPIHSDEPVNTCDRVLSLVTIYPLVQFSADNGATRVVPGSHRRNCHPNDEEPGWEPIVAAPGSCILLLGGVWHGRCANRMESIRSMMAAFFVRSWIRPNVDFTRVVDPEILARAPARARELYGFKAQPPYTETWQWDFEKGCPKDSCEPEAFGRPTTTTA